MTLATRYGVRPLVAAALVVPLLAACTAGSDGDGPPTDELAPAWTAEDVDTAIGGAWDRPALWVTDEVLVSVGGPVRSSSSTAVGLDRETGERLWSVSLDGQVCSVSSDVGEDGTGAVLLGSPAGTCDTVAAIDTAAGELLWTALLDSDAGFRQQPSPQDTQVGVGATSVNVALDCGRVLRLDPADGSTVESLGAPSDTCDGPGGVGGSLVAWTEGRGDDAETVLLDTDLTGAEAELWRRPATGPVQDVVAQDPAVLDLSSGPRDGARDRALRVVDTPDAAPRDVGLGMGVVERFTPIGRADDVLLGTYGDQQLHALDLTSGEVLWDAPVDRFSADRRLVGATDDATVWLQGRVDGDRSSDREIWVTTSDPRDPDSGRTLGAIRQEWRASTSDLWYVVDGLLVTAGSRISVYDLDVPGTDGVRVVPADEREDADDQDGWTDADVRPEDALGSCRAVGDETLAAIGVSTEQPAPVRCRWDGQAGRDDVGLVTTAEAKAPGSDDTASEAAAAVLEQRGAVGSVREVAWADQTVVGATAADPLTTTAGTFGASTTTTTVLARRGNVVVTVQLTLNGPTSGLAQRPGPAELEDAALDAAADVFGATGDTPAPPRVGADGPVTELTGRPCPPRSQAARLVPEWSETVDRAPDGRRDLCSRAVDDAFPDVSLDVLREAVAPRAGQDATAVAVDRIADLLAPPPDLGLTPGREIGGVGDEAVLLEGSSFEESRSLVVRRGNVLVTVRHQVSGDDVPLATAARLRAVAEASLPR